MRFDDKPGDPARELVAGKNGAYPTSGVTYGATGAIANDPSTAVTFDGTTGHVKLENDLFPFAGLAPFSVEVWVNTTASKNAQIIDHESFEGPRVGWVMLMDTNGGVTFERWGSFHNAVGGGPINDGKWHHLVGTFDGARMKLYIDGVLTENNTSNVTIVYDASSPFAIGKQSCCSNAYPGSVDEIAIYDKALLDVQINAHLAAAK